MSPDPQLDAVIAAVPEWRGHEPEITPVEAGRTNRNFRVEVGSGTFFLRLSHEDSALLGIDRTAEYEAALAAAAAGVGPEVIAHLPEHGCLITVWVPGEPLAEGDMDRGSVLADVVRVVSTFHAGPALPTTFDAFRIVEEYRRVSEEHGVAIPDAYDPAHAHAERIEAAFARAPVPPSPCHNDLLADNFLKGDDGLWLVDYEYSGMGDPFFDLGNFSINHELEPEADDVLLQAYDGAVLPARRARLVLMRVVSDFREAMWGVLQQGISSLDVDFVAYAGEHFERLLANASGPGFEQALRDAAGG